MMTMTSRLPLALSLGVLAGLFGCSGNNLAPEQPIPFNHALHMSEDLQVDLEENQLLCTDCHPGAETRAQAGLPSITYCLRCHMRPQGDGKSGLEPQVREYALAKGPFRWIQVTREPGHVYFSHRAHTSGAGFQCEECHGDVRAWTRPPRRPIDKLLHMNKCMACHRARGVSNECGTCHR